MRAFQFLVLLSMLFASSGVIAQCPTGAQQVAPTCSGISYEGCCLPDQTLQWCENGVLCAIFCAQNPDPAYQKCGWSPEAGFYDCGSSTSPEPSCTHPMDCPGNCKPCGDITYEGCCDGAVVTWCECGCIRTINCAENSPPNDTCGWNATYSFYDCGQVGGDPSGIHPLECPGGPCTPSCGGKQCGPDGCGGSCGTCPAGYVCNAQGLCEVQPCTPNCAGKQCGPDGCGGSCGTCPAGNICQNGICVSAGCGADPAQTCQGLCGDAGTGGCWCDDLCEAFGDCCPDYEACCSGQCVPDCTFKECGPDGCGGSCGTCPQGQTCNSFGQCVSSGCTPACAGKECGPDGCGGTCGTCPAGKVCNAQGLCEATCTPSCVGKECGDDGCGGSCGSCPQGYVCKQGTCVKYEPCIPQCEGKQCGPDGCDGSCGVCAPPLECNEQGRCYDPHACVPSCTGKQCGPDGCGGLCGSCPPGQFCTPDGRCQGTDAAGEDLGTPADRDIRASETATTCPPGYASYYGTCIPQTQDSGMPAPGGTGGGCTTTHLPGPPWVLALALSLLSTRFLARKRQ